MGIYRWGSVVEPRVEMDLIGLPEDDLLKTKRPAGRLAFRF
jgi:hypothetical protein